jgi:trans-2-enoyl-CoA reductase
MTEAVLDLDEHTNYVLNIIKERYNLKDISEANNLMALQYEEDRILGQLLTSEYLKELEAAVKGKHTVIGTIDEFDKWIDNLFDCDTDE